MGLFKNLISDAVNEGVGKGIREGVGKGLRDAVGKAVETAVQPAADKLAGQAAEHLNEARQSLEESTRSIKSAQADAQNAFAEADAEIAAQTGAPAGDGAAASEPKLTGTASLEAALAGWAGAMQNAATQASQNMKECPKCGEVVTADHKFCPKCGSALPEMTIAEGFLCPKCGKQNVPGTTYCAECGTKLPAAEAADARQMARWDEWIPQYPKWTFGGEPELEQGDVLNDEPTVRFTADGAGAQELSRYVALLKENGFVPAYGDGSDVYYKVVDGVCRAFDMTDATSGGSVSVTFFVGDYDKRAEKEAARQAAKAAAEKAERERKAEVARAAAETAKDTAKAAAESAKGLFKRFMK